MKHPFFSWVLQLQQFSLRHTLRTDGGGDLVELAAQVGAQSVHRGNDHYGDQGHQQAILHGAGPGFVLEEISELFHGSLFA